jgi:hypothetical protein
MVVTVNGVVTSALEWPDIYKPLQASPSSSQIHTTIHSTLLKKVNFTYTDKHHQYAQTCSGTKLPRRACTSTGHGFMSNNKTRPEFVSESAHARQGHGELLTMLRLSRGSLVGLQAAGWVSIARPSYGYASRRLTETSAKTTQAAS